MNVTQDYKNFINLHYERLAAYDTTRPENHVYEFHHHAKRVAQLTQQLSLAAGYNEKMADAMYWATLPHDIGKTALPVAIWDLIDKPTEKQREERRAHTWQAANIVRNEFGETCDRDPFLKLMIDIMTNHHECLDGSGFMGKTASDLTPEVRIVCICDAYDGWSVKRPHFGERDVSPRAILNRMKIEKLGQFDPELLNLFETVIMKETP